MAAGQIDRKEAVKALNDTKRKFEWSLCAKPNDYERGFIDGLSHAIIMIKKFVPESEIGQIAFQFEEEH